MKVEVRVAECRRRQASPSGLLCEHISNCDTTGPWMKPSPAACMKFLKRGKEKIVLCRSLCVKPEEVLPSVISGAFQVHSRTFRVPCAVLAVCLESLFCWKVNLWPSLRCRVLCIRFLSSLSMYFTTYGFSPITINLFVPASTKEKKKKLWKLFCLSWTSGIMETTVLLGTFTAAELFLLLSPDLCLHNERSLVIKFKGHHKFCECLWYNLQKWTNEWNVMLPCWGFGWLWRPFAGKMKFIFHCLWSSLLLLTLHLAHQVSSLSPFFSSWIVLLSTNPPCYRDGNVRLWWLWWLHHLSAAVKPECIVMQS